MSDALSAEPYFLHTLVGYRDQALGHIMTSNGREWPSIRKMDMFFEADPETPEGLVQSLGLDLREVMCTVSKRAPASTYHSPYGLVLDGVVKACFDNDTGRMLQADGMYNDHVFDFTNEATPESLMGKWYDNFVQGSSFTWNEVILQKGARIIGAFHDPRAADMGVSISDCSDPEREYGRFLAKAQRCGLELLEITAKYGLY